MLTTKAIVPKTQRSLLAYSAAPDWFPIAGYIAVMDAISTTKSTIFIFILLYYTMYGTTCQLYCNYKILKSHESQKNKLYP